MDVVKRRFLLPALVLRTAERSPGDLLRLSADGTVQERLRLPPGFFPSAATMAFGSLWLADGGHRRVLRIPLGASS